jgi:hypothetical protein
MAKDLPYFKFIVSEWNDGDITLCSMEAQGLFINLCALYWSQEGQLSITKCKRRYKDCNTVVWDELVNEGIIKVFDDRIVIHFLDEQFNERVEVSDKNRKNVLKRWKKEGKNTTVLPNSNDRKELVYNIEERREEKKREERELYHSPKVAFEDISTNYKETESHVNIIANKGWRAATQKDSNALLFHFLESQVDFSTQSPSDVKNHFRRWLNKQPIENLQQLTQKIHERTR